MCNAIIITFIPFADSWDGSGTATNVELGLINTPLPHIPSALNQAVAIDPQLAGQIPSTKGSIEH